MFRAKGATKLSFSRFMKSQYVQHFSFFSIGINEFFENLVLGGPKVAEKVDLLSYITN